MTNPEFSNEFDVLYNNITSNQAPGLNEYEKSVFLTKAQNELIKNYFNPKGNKYQEGYDDSAKRQIDFSTLVTTYSNTEFSSAPFSSKAKKIEIPSNIMMFLNEILYVQRGGNNIELSVIPITYEEYSRLMSKPYKRPLKNQAWRLITNIVEAKREVELIAGPNDTLLSYSIRYVRKPKAIILTDLEGVTLDGVSKEQECELDSILHTEILQRAVELAKAAYTGDLNSSVELGKRSE